MVKIDEAVSSLVLMKSDISQVNVNSSNKMLFNAAVLRKSISARLNTSIDFLLDHCKIMNDKHATKLEKRNLPPTSLKLLSL